MQKYKHKKIYLTLLWCTVFKLCNFQFYKGIHLFYTVECWSYSNVIYIYIYIYIYIIYIYIYIYMYTLHFDLSSVLISIDCFLVYYSLIFLIGRLSDKKCHSIKFVKPGRDFLTSWRLSNNIKKLREFSFVSIKPKCNY